MRAFCSSVLMVGHISSLAQFVFTCSYSSFDIFLFCLLLFANLSQWALDAFFGSVSNALKDYKLEIIPPQSTCFAFLLYVTQDHDPYFPKMFFSLPIFLDRRNSC